MRSELPDTCTASASRPAEREPSALLAPDTWIARYRIVGLLGRGGLGNVYRAHDTELARDIALKILHRRYGPDTHPTAPQRRLLLEGQALAKLSHPNVVTVYDVGIDDDVVFIAMELVDGQSLQAWLDAGARRDELLRVLIAAGRGLAAAHAAGLIHGDFKPANVMLAHTGQVRIVDFGLARSIGDGSVVADAWSGSSPALSPALPESGAAASDQAFAPHSTAVCGTPGYIAPELLLGHGAANAQADQYSFAVTAFVALTGQKPYAGHTLQEYHGSLASGVRLVWPAGMPRRIGAVIERGLSLSPHERYPSLEALLDALERASTPRLARGAWIALPLAGLLLASAAAAVVRGGAHGTPCEVDTTPFAGVWDAERREALERALLATGRPNAREAFALLATRLDAFETGWVEMKGEACQSSLVKGAQSERVFALRSNCLKHKLEGFGALIEAFAHADARSVDRAGGAMPEPIDECADVAMLTGVADALPVDPARRASIDEISSGLAVVGAEFSAGRDARTQARQLHDAALGIGHAPTIVQTLSAVARSLVASNRGDATLREAKEILNEVMRKAALLGDRRLLARTASYLLNIVGFREKRTDEADAMLPMVAALVDQGGNEPEVRLELLVSQGAILTQRGKYLEANAVFEQAVALSREVQTERKAYGALALGQIGENYIQLGRYAEAVRSRQAEVDGVRSIDGALHPRVLLSTYNLGMAQVKAGQLDGARATAANLGELVARLLSAGDWQQATLPFLQGNIAERSGDCAAALPLYRATLQLLTPAFGPEHANTADVYERLGSCLHALRQEREAAAQLEHALAIRRALGGTPKIAECAFQLADVLWAVGQAERGRAIALADEAVSLWQSRDVSEARAAAERWLAERSGRQQPAEPPAPSQRRLASSAPR